MLSFTYVFIPADDKLPLEQRKIDYAEQDIVGCLTTALSKHFVETTSNKEAKAAEASMMNALKDEAKSKGYTVPKAKMVELARTQMVHVENLYYGSAKNDWLTVALYSDDSAVSKGCPVNNRATQLALACGKSIQMLGDTFLASAQDDTNDLYCRLDTQVAQCATDAAWVGDAKADNVLRLAGAGAYAPSAPPVSQAGVASQEQLSKFAEELANWIGKKLAEWDNDEAARKKHEKKHRTREAFEASLREKAKAKMQASTKVGMSSFADDATNWVQTELEVWDNDKKARKKLQEEHGTRDAYKASLLARAAERGSGKA